MMNISLNTTWPNTYSISPGAEMTHMTYLRYIWILWQPIETFSLDFSHFFWNILSLHIIYDHYPQLIHPLWYQVTFLTTQNDFQWLTNLLPFYSVHSHNTPGHLILDIHVYTVTPKTLSILTPNVVGEVHHLTAWEFHLALVELYIVYTPGYKIAPWVMWFGVDILDETTNRTLR